MQTRLSLTNTDVILYKSKITQESTQQAQFMLSRLLIDAALKQLQKQVYFDERQLSWSLPSSHKKLIKRRRAFLNQWIDSEYNLTLNKPQTTNQNDSLLLSSINALLNSDHADVSIFTRESERLLENKHEFADSLYHQHFIVRYYYVLACRFRQRKMEFLQHQLMDLSNVTQHQELIHDSLLSYVNDEVGELSRSSLEKISLYAQYPALLSQSNLPSTHIIRDVMSLDSVMQQSVIDVDLKVAAQQMLKSIQGDLASILDLNHSTTLADIKASIVSRKRYFVSHKTGRRSLLYIYSVLQSLIDSHSEVLASMSNLSGEVKLNHFALLKIDIQNRFTHLESLSVMALKKITLLRMKTTMEDVIELLMSKIYMQLGQIHLRFLNHSSQRLPIEQLFDHSTQALQLKHREQYARHLKHSYRLNVSEHSSLSRMNSLLEANHQLPGDYNAPSFVVHPNALEELDVGLLVTLAYAYHTHQGNNRFPFIPILWTPQGVSIHPELKAHRSRYADVITIIQNTRAYPAFYLAILMLTIGLIREHRTSKEYNRLYHWLSLLLTQQYHKIMAGSEDSDSSNVDDSDEFDDDGLSWVAAYLPKRIESISSHDLSYLRSRLIGRTQTSNSSIFLPPKPGYVEEAATRRLSVEDILCSTPELSHRHSSFSFSRSSLSRLSMFDLSPKRKKTRANTLENFKMSIKEMSEAIMRHSEDWKVIDNAIEGHSLSYKELNKIYYQCERQGLDKHFGMMYVLIVWYIDRRNAKLRTAEANSYKDILNICHTMQEALCLVLQGEKRPTAEIFNALINHQVRSLPSSARKLRDKIMQLIPFSELGYSLSDSEIAVSKQAIEIFKRLTSYFDESFEQALKNSVIELLLEYRGGHQQTILALSLLLAYKATHHWQRIKHTAESYSESRQFVEQFNEVIIRYYVALEGNETHFPSSSLVMFPPLTWIQQEYARGMAALVEQMKELSATPSVITENQKDVAILDSVALNRLSQEQAITEVCFYLQFVFADLSQQLNSYQPTIPKLFDQLVSFSTSLKIIYVLLDAYESCYSVPGQECGLAAVSGMKNRIQRCQFFNMDMLSGREFYSGQSNTVPALKRLCLVISTIHH